MPSLLKRAVGKACCKFFSALPVGRYIIFESVPDLGDSTMPIFEEMIARGLNKCYKLVWWVNDQKGPSLPKFDGVIYVDARTALNRRLFQYYRLRAKCLIYCNKIMHKDNSKTKSFFITHGTAIKSVKSYYNAPSDLDYCLVTSKDVVEMMSDQFCVPQNKMVALGYPRNDALTNVRVDLHRVIDKNFSKVIVWYPTFRQHKKSKNPLSGNSLPIIHDAEKAQKLNEVLKAKDILIVMKPHFAQDVSYVKDLHLSNIMFIDDSFFAGHNTTSYQFVGSCDALLTDYSSIYFDYLLCDKPIGLVWEDIDSYRENPGFAIDLDYYMKAGEKIYNLNDLIRFVEDLALGNDRLKAERHEINELANYASDGKNTERVVDFIIKKAKL